MGAVALWFDGVHGVVSVVVVLHLVTEGLWENLRNRSLGE